MPEILNATMEALGGVYRALDEAREQQMRKDSICPTCKKGCSFCCQYLITATIPEAVAAMLCGMANGITIDVIDQALRPQVKALINERDMTSKTWLARRYPCPFLISTECAIYEYRSMACRNNLVITPPEQCQLDSLVGAMDCRDLTAQVGTQVMPQIAREMGLVSSGTGPWPIVLYVAGIYISSGPKYANDTLKVMSMHTEIGCLEKWLYLERMQLTESERTMMAGGLRRW